MYQNWIFRIEQSGNKFLYQVLTIFSCIPAFLYTQKLQQDCRSHQQLTDLIRPLVDHRDSVDLPEFIAHMDQTCEEER